MMGNVNTFVSGLLWTEAYHEGTEESSLEVVADGDEQLVSACDHGHAGRHVAHHVV